MLAALLTWAGASVGVSISTQRRMPSRIAKASKGLVVDIQIDRTGENEGTRQREWDPSAFSAAAKSASPVTQAGVGQACKRAARSCYCIQQRGQQALNG